MLAKEALRIVPFVGRGLDAVANDLLGPGFVAYSEDCPTEYQHFSYYADCYSDNHPKWWDKKDSDARIRHSTNEANDGNH